MIRGMHITREPLPPMRKERLPLPPPPADRSQHIFFYRRWAGRGPRSRQRVPQWCSCSKPAASRVVQPRQRLAASKCVPLSVLSCRTAGPRAGAQQLWCGSAGSSMRDRVRRNKRSSHPANNRPLSPATVSVLGVMDQDQVVGKVSVRAHLPPIQLVRMHFAKAWNNSSASTVLVKVLVSKLFGEATDAGHRS
jgi:hypothetical protein